MGTFIDLLGQKFGRLTVIERAENYNNRIHWKCLCDCGNYCYISTKTLRNGTAKSCGCLRVDLLKQRVCKHSMSNTKLYQIWKNIKKRCYGKTSYLTKYYKDKGIIMCEEWKNDFQAFYDWAVNNGYDSSTHRGVCTLDRINYCGNYEPSNCRWITIQEQQLNKSSNRLITYNNETHCISEWAKILNIKPKTLEMRFLRGWDIEKALTTPL